ncbi:MAG: class GN sortase [Hyphomonas oceanitis]|uniref:class GN sortase n=1 Tax=Hyphomonas oceanitis TaxID=81033 RepID=UPI003002B9A6
MPCDAAAKNPPPTWGRWPRRGRRGAFLTSALLLTGLFLFGNGAYMKAKASLSQILLAHAWEQTLQGASDTRPWPWADVMPAAKLELPRLHASAIVLTGTSGQALAFGPGVMEGSAAPGEPGLTLLAGHRDSHFAFLQHAEIGDAITLTGPDGTPHIYTLTETRIVDANASLLRPGGTGAPTLALTTCYPFSGVTPTSQRYIAIAQMKDPPTGEAGGSGPVAEAKALSGAVAIPEAQVGDF